MTLEKQEPHNWLEEFTEDTTRQPHSQGYIPLPTNVPEKPEGSIFMAHLRQENTIGSLITRQSMYELDEDAKKNYDFINYIDMIPRDLITYADRFYGARSPDEFQSIEAKIRQELSDKSLLAAYPMKSFMVGLGASPLDPVNWLPIGEVYKGVKAGASIAKSMIGVGITAAGSSAFQEAILHQNQLAREAQESINNILVSGVVGAALGGIGAGIGMRRQRSGAQEFEARQIMLEQTSPEQSSSFDLVSKEAFKTRQKVTEDVSKVFREEDIPLDTNGLLKSEDLDNMPKPFRKAMQITPLNRLINSNFGISKWFASQTYEHNYNLVKNTDGISTGVSIERSIIMDTRAVGKALVDYQDIYYDMHGITKGVFKGTKESLRGKRDGLNRDQFDEAVSLVLTSNEPHVIPQVNVAAKLLREKIFDPFKNEAIRLGILPEDTSVSNAVDYFMIMYNKNKIIEQGAKHARGAGTFPQYIFDQFKASNEITNQYINSPKVLELQEEVKSLTKQIKKRPAEQLNKINSRIKTIDTEIKEIGKLKNKLPDNEIQSINQEIKKLKTQLKDLNDEIKERQSNYVEQIKKEIQSHKDGVEVYKTRRVGYNSKLSKLNKSIESSNKRIAELSGRIKEIKISTPKKERMLKNLNQFKEKHTKLLNDKKDTANILKEVDGHIKTHNQRTRELNRISKLTEENVPALRLQIKEIDTKITELNKSKTISPEELRTRNNNLTRLKKEKDTLLKSREVTKKEQDAFKKRITEIKKQIIDEAPAGAKNYEGELHTIIDSEEVMWAQVEQTIDNILGNTDGKLNPFLERLTSSSGKPLKGRKLLIDQKGAREWHITNAVKVAESYSRAMIPVIRITELAKRMGFNTIPELREGLGVALKKEYNIKSKGLTGKKSQQLLREYNNNIEDINATFDLLMGVYGDGVNTLNNNAKQYYQNFLKWNYVRLLGGMTISSFADAGAMVLTHGFYRTLHSGIKSLASQAGRITRTDLRAIGYGIETELATRVRSFVEHEGLSTNPGAFTKGLESLTRHFGNLSLMNPWNNMMHNISGTASINRTLEMIHKIVTGEKVSKKEIERLARLGIDKENFKIIYNFTKNNRDSSGAYYADWANWNIKNAKDAQALKQFQAAVGKEIDSMILIPGLGDKPLLAHSPIGIFLFQFKSFLMTATNRILYSGIQRRKDINIYQGIASMLALGALSYIVISYTRGKEPDLSFQNLSSEAIDRSGLLGIWSETFGLGKKFLGLGEISRYQSDGILTALGGPSVGALSDTQKILSKTLDATTGDRRLTTKDTEKILRLAPLQNLFYLHQLNRAINKEVATELGAVPVD